MKLQGFFQTPQDIMGEYDGCSVPQYTAYPLLGFDILVITNQLQAPLEQFAHHFEIRRQCKELFF